MRKIILALVALTCISSDLSRQTLTRKGSSAKSQKSTSPVRRTVHIGKPPDNPVLSPAIVAGGLVFTSGQIGIDPKTSQMVEGGFEAQAEQVLRNLATVLEAAGSDMSQVLKTTVFLADMDNFNKMNEIYRRYFKEDPPARSTVQVARLPRNALIEIEAVALLKK